MNGFQVAGMVIGFIGIVIVGLLSSWWVAAGVFLMLLGNNLEQNHRS